MVTLGRRRLSLALMSFVEGTGFLLTIKVVHMGKSPAVELSQFLLHLGGGHIVRLLYHLLFFLLFLNWLFLQVEAKLLQPRWDHL